LKVLLSVHQFLPRHVTGTEQYVRSIALGLIGRGHEVRVFAFEPLVAAETGQRLWFQRDEVVDDIPVRRVGLHPEECAGPVLADHENPIVGRLFERFLDEHRFDVVHLFHPRHLGLAAVREPKRRGLPVVASLMDFYFLCPNFMLLRRDGVLCDGPPAGGLGCVPCIDPGLGSIIDSGDVREDVMRLAHAGGKQSSVAQRPIRRAYALLRRKQSTFAALETVDAILAPSRFLLRKFVEAGFPERRLEHVPYGVDKSRLAGFVKRRPRKGKLAIGYIGSVTPHKGLDVLIAAVRGLRDPGVTLAVHGSLGTHSDFTRRVRELTAGDRRIEFCGPFAPNRLGSVLSRCDVLAVPSVWYENTPFTVLEAQAAGIGVVASDLGGLAEIVEPGANGWLFPAGDFRALQGLLASLVPAQGRALRGASPPPPLDANLDAIEAVYRRVSAGASRVAGGGADSRDW
jgi:glycosyltransferase involved in cell wall biosynthesis